MRKKRPVGWFIFILLFTFVVAFGIGLAAETLFHADSILVCCTIIVLLLIIAFLGDIVAMSVSYADLAPFNSMASRKIRGARIAIKLINNNDKIASILSDVLGDVCAIVSGAIGASLSLIIVLGGTYTAFQQTLIIVTVTATISAIAVSVKSIAKKVAVRYSTGIILAVSKFLSLFVKNG